jgi:WD40 repeat protein
LAPALQSALERFTKRWYRIRAFRIFRDTTNLSLAPELWTEIEKALSQSEFLLFLASPEAAKSKWVKKELTYWLEKKESSTLLIILTAGEIVWDDIAGDFDWSRTSSIPDVLSRVFAQEPLYLDFRQLRASRLSLDDKDFLDHIATIAAPLHGKSKDEIYGEHIRQHRKTMRLVWSAVISLIVLTTVAFWQYGVAEKRREQAEQKTRVATAQRLGAQSQLVLNRYPERSLLLAVEAFRITEQKGEPRVPAAEEALRQALATIGGRGLGRHPGDDNSMGDPRAPEVVEADCLNVSLGGLGYRSGNPASKGAISPGSRFLLTVGKYESDRLVAISPKGRWLLTMGDNSTARLWDLSAKDPGAAPIILHDDERILSANFTPDERWLITGGWSWQADQENEFQNRARYFINPYMCRRDEGQKTVRLCDLSAKDPASSRVILRGHEKHVDALALSPDGRWLVTGSWDKTARIWDLRAKDPASSSTVLRGHDGEVYAVAITNDSQQLITGSADRTARVWNLAGPDPTASSIVLPGHESEVSLVAVTPDGRRVFTAGWDTTPRLWDLAAKAPSASAIILDKIEKTLEWIRLSPDGRWLITGGRFAYASLMDLKAPNPASSYMILPSYDGQVKNVAFSPDSHWLVTTAGYLAEELAHGVDPEHVARLWNLTAEDPSASPLELKGHQGVIFDADMSRGSSLATGSADGTIRIWSLKAEDPSAAPTVLRGHEDAVYRVAFSPDGRWLITASLDGNARLWDLTAGDFMASPLRLSTGGEVSSLAISEDSHWLFSFYRLWNLTADNPIMTETILPGLGPPIPGWPSTSADKAKFSPDARWLATSSYAHSGDALILWDLGGEPSMKLDLAEQGSRIADWSFSRNGRWFVVQTRSDSWPAVYNVQLWDLTSTAPAASSPIVLSGHTGPVDSIDISEDGHWLVTGGKDKTARLWDLTSNDPSAQAIILHNEDQVDRVSFSPDNRRLITGTWGKYGGQRTVRLRGLTADSLAASHMVQDHGNKIWELEFSPDGRWLATGGVLGDTIRLWNQTKLDPSMILPVQADMTSPDVHWAVTSSYGKPSQLWDLTQKPPQATTLLGHSHPTTKAIISPDSHWLFTADSGPEQTCRIWDLTAPEPSSSAANLPTQECQADLMIVTPDGRWLITAGSRTGVRRWHIGIPTLLDLAQRTAGRGLTTEERKEYLPIQPETN